MNNAIKALRDLVANDSFAMTFQTMGQYRSALLKAADEQLAAAAQGWPCEIVEADFQHGEVLLHMRCSNYQVTGGTHYLYRPAPPQQPVANLPTPSEYD